jgi:O-antigen ligase
VNVKTASSEIKLGPLATVLEWGIAGALFLFALAAPNSIAATQTAWVLGLLFWVARLAIWPRPELHRTPVDYAMFGFFVLTGLSAFLSYEPMVSIGKLRAATLFTIVYLFAENVRSPRMLRALAIVLVASATISVLYTFGQYAVGRGIKVYEVSPASPLGTARLVSRTENRALPIFTGDTLLEIDRHALRSVDQLVASLDGSPQDRPAQIRIYRFEWMPLVEVPRGRLLPGSTPEERLGIRRWTRGRDWRAAGFFGHYTTYAEALQLIASLALGLFIALPQKRTRNGLLLALAIAGMCAALLLTVTRGSWLAFAVSAALIVALGVSRRTLLVIGACALPLILVGLLVLQQKRNVGFFDQNDNSTTWRETVWREGFHLLTSSPRHLLVGVGMDSIKAHWREWGLFDNGRLPIGHMHNDYLQIALERGVPALFVWLILMGTYARTLWRLRLRVPGDNWIERGIVLGALGGLIGFMISGLFHYNWGDSEVVMIFYMIMGLSLVIERKTRAGDSVRASDL